MRAFNAKDPLTQIGIASVVFTVPAILTTVYRLYIRRNRYWADDLFALFSMLAQFIMFSGAFIHITHSSPRLSMVAAYYMMASAFYSVVWFARLSIVFSIIRIHPDQGMRRKLYWVAALFVVITAVLISQLYWVCEPAGGQWKNTEAPQCSLTRQVVIFQIVTDVLSDAILVFVPIRLIQTISDKKLRHRLAVIFSTCLITTAVSLVHAAFILVHAGPQEVIAAITEDCVSLIVCNVPVVATRLIQKWNMHKESEERTTTGVGGSTTAISIKFATWVSETFRSGGTKVRNVRESTVSATTGTANEANPGWFRWERDLGEDSSSDGGVVSRQTHHQHSELGQGERERSTRNQAFPTVTLDLCSSKADDPELLKSRDYDDDVEKQDSEEGQTGYPPRKQTVTWVDDVMDRCEPNSPSRT
ncbi:hypothetical protein E1B28_010596 [Marasmius oreades]|nr:uncharacterized protein E1B28_010596 [Marasmius oreades]KAG7091574.1 hypothetical protein E1B28_010596 [Marasmius oreades]